MSVRTLARLSLCSALLACGANNTGDSTTVAPVEDGTEGNPAVLAPSDPVQHESFWVGNVTLINCHWRDLLRNHDDFLLGQSLYLQSVNKGLITPGAEYRLTVTHPRTGRTLVDVDPLSDANGLFDMAPVLHEAGQEDAVEVGDTLEVTLGRDGVNHEAVITVGARLTDSEHGPNPVVAEPLVRATDKNGVPRNSFVVEGLVDGEVAGQDGVYVSGSGFDASTGKVDIYVFEDRDEWAGQPLSTRAGEGFISKVSGVDVLDGVLEPTYAKFRPSDGRSVGTYDIIVDVNRDGVFDYDELHKDGVDGEARVGFTVQYSSEWLAAQHDKHLLVNLAYNSSKRRGGQWQNFYEAGEKVFAYVNPPVSKKYHAKVMKYVVAHRDFASFWDKPGVDGAVDFSHIIVGSQEGVPQKGCTNSPPSYLIQAGVTADRETGQTIDRFDIVLDYDHDQKYTPGVDLLDCVGFDSNAELINPNDVRALAENDERQGGYVVVHSKSLMEPEPQ